MMSAPPIAADSVRPIPDPIPHEERANGPAVEQGATGPPSDLRITMDVVLLIVVIAIVGLTALAMLQKLESEAFAGLMAPLSGVAGVVLGYFFGNRRR